MFGIGFWEFIVIAVVVILAIGPDRMPGFFKTIGRTIRLFRKTTKDLKNTIGLDELLRDDDLRRLQKPAHVTPAPAPKPPEIRTYELTDDDRAREHPAGGVDLEDVRHRAARAKRLEAEKLEAARLEAEKREAEKLAAEKLEAEKLAGGSVEAEHPESGDASHGAIAEPAGDAADAADATESHAASGNGAHTPDAPDDEPEAEGDAERAPIAKDA
jgi:Tat protein translocase TatB subunit